MGGEGWRIKKKKKLSAFMRVEQPGRSLEEQPDEDTRHTVRSGSGTRRDKVWDKT